MYPVCIIKCDKNKKKEKRKSECPRLVEILIRNLRINSPTH